MQYLLFRGISKTLKRVRFVHEYVPVLMADLVVEPCFPLSYEAILAGFVSFSAHESSGFYYDLNLWKHII